MMLLLVGGAGMAGEQVLFMVLKKLFRGELDVEKNKI